MRGENTHTQTCKVLIDESLVCSSFKFALIVEEFMLNVLNKMCVCLQHEALELLQEENIRLQLLFVPAGLHYRKTPREEKQAGQTEK